MDQSAEAEDLIWRAGVPVSRRHDDPYFSRVDGLGESRHVFLAGNALPARLRPGFRVAELGTGAGLNLLALAQAAEAAGVAPIRYTGFELRPLPPAAIARALAAFPSLAPLAQVLASAWRTDGFAARIGPVEAEMIVGDARRTLPAWGGRAEAWFLDGFAPARNPELWERELMAAVAGHTAARGTFATYTAAGAVRRALASAGFAVQRRPGFGTKRHMTTGRLA
jgi:tRNA U34 5-methylaminomethyl-2-thiouridine-forming methyltransferase MnmC